MAVNGITSSVQETSYTNSTKKSAKASDSTTASTKAYEQGVVYEKSTYKADNEALVAQMKADTEARTSQLKSLVEQMFLKQGQKVTSLDDMWKKLASGNFTADEATIKNAQAEISEDGYWGVEQTSQRIFDFAYALSGGDSDKMDDMLEAFEKGFKQATKTWGRDLPDISSQTYDAVHQKFADYKNQNTVTE